MIDKLLGQILAVLQEIVLLLRKQPKEAPPDVEYPPCVYPVPVLPDGRQGKITSRFKSVNKSRPKHNGDDWLYRRRPNEPKDRSEKWIVPKGIVAIAVRSGSVWKAGRINTGYRCWVRHGDGSRSGYFHLSRLFVTDNEYVFSGQPLGIIGNNPADAGDPNHLHFEVCRGGAYLPIDPWEYLQTHGAEHSVPRPPNG